MGRKHEPRGQPDAGKEQGPPRQCGLEGNAVRKPREPTETIAVVLKVKDIERIDALGGLFSASWHKATRSDIVRGLLLPALDEAEKQLPSPAPRKRVRATVTG
jgi:hypothetical protein